MIWCFGEHELDDQRFELRARGVKVAVQPKVLDTLLLLLRSRDRVVLKQELLDTVWPGVAVSDASISRVIMEARKAIGDELQQIIVTVRGRGFRFASEVEARDKPTFAEVPEPQVDPTFVGRCACLAAADAKLTDASRGQGNILWLSGEAGIGKSRTAEEIARRARLVGSTVLFAHAHETPEAPAFWLWTQIIRAHAATQPDGATRGVLQQLAPMMTLGAAPHGTTEFSLFDAVARCLREACALAPLVLVLDDLHWADEGSLRLLQFVVRELRQSPVWIVATFRDTGLKGGSFGKLFGDLLRERGSFAVPLRGMSLPEATRFVEVSTGASPSPDFAAALLERSGGNPLYMQQVLRTEWAERALNERAHEMASSMDLQQGLIESICRHVDSLSPETREMLTAAAVLGGDFEMPKLLTLFDTTPTQLLDRVDEAARARVLVKGKDGSFRFAHALVREVLYKKLSSADRMARHRDTAAKLLAHYGDDVEAHAGELARHLVRALPAADPAQAIDLSILAARQQAALGFHKEAARHWQHALSAFAHVKGDDARRVRTSLELARALAACGQESAAREAFLDAAILARTFSMPVPLGEAALGFAAIAGDAQQQRGAMLKEAIVTLNATKDPANAGLEAALKAASVQGPN